jgi:hypothetical protein
MKFKISRASSWSNENPPTPAAIFIRKEEWGDSTWEIEINSMEELMALISKEGDLIISGDNPNIIIYDAYVE